MRRVLDDDDYNDDVDDDDDKLYPSHFLFYFYQTDSTLHLNRFFSSIVFLLVVEFFLSFSCDF